MLDGGDSDDGSVLVKADAVVTDAQTELRRVDTLELLYIAIAGGGQIRQRVKDAQGGRLVDGAKLGFGLILPDDRSRHA